MHNKTPSVAAMRDSSGDETRRSGILAPNAYFGETHVHTSWFSHEGTETDLIAAIRSSIRSC